MSRRAKGPRLYLRKGRITRGGDRLPDTWVIRDGAHEVSTGCSVDGLPTAERALAEYIASKWRPHAAPGASARGDPAQVSVAEVLALYAQERAPQLKSDPHTTAGFVRHLLTWWGERMVSDVKRSSCKAYVEHRIAQPIRHGETGRLVSQQTARRELEVLSAAIGYWHGEDTLATRPKVWLPDKPESPRDALTRAQAAALLKAACGYRKLEDGTWTRLGSSARANRAHLRRFILIGLYTGTRHSVITKLLWAPSATQAWVDLDRGMIFRRGKEERESRTKRRPVVKLSPRLLAHMHRWRKLDERATGNDDQQTARYATVLHHGGFAISGKIRRGFASCVRDAGLSAEITPHWMRHTCATWLMEAGAELWQAAGYTGMTTAVLEKHYGHHRPDHQAGAIEALKAKRPPVR
ncbi:tyrosine-type recombinase/integrase [Phenylobacterium sp. 58.2.17]|uniref:tyrosine-type recombinase/integrase n=1 Tax=Phenylobacterium sp. 58.2.17 TaxID=2969306 RepID=UPI002264799D|nr:tyrosine-type recombinase/integrase [Phenylobacterium sp. 58.2.17]MCX7584870.1 tyrosine-type recombinase/integrase [Phenylobacterium sp. 58.2.17]